MKEKINYQEMTDSDLKNRVTEIGNELLGARQKYRVGQFKKTSDFTRLRREVARVNTILRQRELSQGEQAKKKTEKKRA